MKVAILTHPGDTHAHAVAWGIRQRGADCDLIFFSDLPQKATLSIDPGIQNNIRFASEALEADLASYSAFWLRKPADAVLPAEMHPADIHVARTFWKFTLDGALRILGESGAFCVNPPIGSEVTRLKPYQLSVARQVGLTIPRTIITSNGKEARSFIANNAACGRETIAKPLYAAMWDFDDGGFAFMETRRVKSEEISDASLKLAPCIFQTEIRKQTEVRLTVMGHSLFAAEIDTRGIPEAQVDFRAAPNWLDLGCKPIKVPDIVASRVLQFQSSCGLNFGTMDFIIEETGEWVFLETNPLGQFLWIEDVHPETTLLDAFVQFILSGSGKFLYGSDFGEKLTLSAFDNSVPGGSPKTALREEKRAHIPHTAPGKFDTALSA